MVKYKQLVEEYNKLQKKNQVLKKAVLQVCHPFGLLWLFQEQETTKELGAVVREKEVALRATKEENEVLSFNNERLTKRVTILQKSMNEQVRLDWHVEWHSLAQRWKFRRMVRLGQSWGGNKNERTAGSAGRRNFQESCGEWLHNLLRRSLMFTANLHSEVHTTRQEQRQVIELLQKKAQNVKQELESEVLHLTPYLDSLHKRDFAKKREREFEEKQSALQQTNNSLNSAINNLSLSVKEYVSPSRLELTLQPSRTTVSKRKRIYVSPVTICKR